MTSQHTIRRAVWDDLAGVLALYRHLHPGDSELDPDASQRIWSAILSGPTISIVAEVDEVLASSCTLAIIPNLTRGGRPYGVVENVVTHPDHRRAGLGLAVLRTALDTAWRSDCYKVMLATGSRQAATLRFYESAGFQQGGKTYFEARRP